MAARGAARVFAMMFKYLAEDVGERELAIAGKLWRAMREFDFSPDQMNCDNALSALLLAKKTKDGEWRYKGER